MTSELAANLSTASEDSDLDVNDCTSTAACIIQSDSPLLAQGAEARLYKGLFYGKPAVFKHRFPKTYRHPVLDKSLTAERLKSEIRCIARCHSVGITVPAIYHVNANDGLIVMQFIDDAVTLREFIQKTQATSGSGDVFEESLRPMMLQVGRILGKLHQENIIHGDLTTSNMLVKQNGSDGETQITLIDFGLSYVGNLAEDKGVDLYVLEKAFLSTHPNTEKLFELILSAYAETSKVSKKVLEKLNEVRKRGRKRDMVG